MNFTRFLTEGMIKLPPKLLKKLQDEVAGVALSMIIDAFNKQLADTELSAAEKKLSQEIFDDWLKKFKGIPVSKHQIKISKKIKIGNVKFDDVPERYRKLLNRPAANEFWSLEGTPLSLRLFMNNFDNEAPGAYNSGSNMVKISLSEFKSLNFSVYFRSAQRAAESPSEVKKKFFMKSCVEVLDRYADRIDRLNGIVEHEVAHYVQYKILSRGHEKQIDHDGKSLSVDLKSKADEEYYTSSVEFDPQIKTAVSDFKTIKRKLLNRVPEADIKALAAWMTASGTRAAALKNVEHGSLVPDEPFEFFTQIKKIDTARWKKAIKLFTTEISK